MVTTLEQCLATAHVQCNNGTLQAWTTWHALTLTAALFTTCHADSACTSTIVLLWFDPIGETRETQKKPASKISLPHVKNTLDSTVQNRAANAAAA
jgi:hypothetical protein